MPRPCCPAVVDFRRVCVWEGAPSSGPAGGGEACGISIWRPVPPPGYVALGDCLVRGYDPPLSASVAQDTGALPALPRQGFDEGKPGGRHVRSVVPRFCCSAAAELEAA